MSNCSVLYYTGNRKPPNFEAKIRQTMMENCGGLPIVSVSQKPIECGKNICVGNVGASYVNVFKQILIGAEAVETEFIFLAEDDFLYPPEFYQFKPTADYYRYGNTWIVSWRGLYMAARPANAVVRREFAIRTMTQCLEGFPDWVDSPPVGKPIETGKPEFMNEPYEIFTGPPVVGFKGKGNLSCLGARGEDKARMLEPWGYVDGLRKRYDYEHSHLVPNEEPVNIS